jgi:hypothetical protein
MSASGDSGSQFSAGQRTAGLKRPPLILKNTQAFTIRLNPNENEIYKSVPGLDLVVDPVVMLSMFATWAPPKARKRNIVVPINSPRTATISADNQSNAFCGRTAKAHGFWSRYA